MRWIALLAAVLLAGCFESQLRYCENGAICPEALACTERAPTACGNEDQVTPCKTMPDRTACSSPSRAIGTCASGVCSPCAPDLVECRYPEWRSMQSPTGELLKTVWVVSDNDVYAAGQGAVVHYDGTAWSMMAFPPTDFAINAMWASAAGDIVAVAQDGEVFRWRSGSWSVITPDPVIALRAIWGTSISELFAVGVMGTILRYDGLTWMPMTSNTALTLGAIWGTTPTNVVAAGNSGAIQRYDGSSWQAAPNTPITGITFRGVWTSGSRIFAVGATSKGTIATQQAADWSLQMVDVPYLASVWGRAEDDVYAVGDAGTIMHYDGATWTMSSTTMSSLEAVSGTATNVFAVGAAGTILRYSPR